MWVESPWGKVRCMCRYSEAVEPGTVWTWNAIGKAAGAWNLTPDANESQRGFLLNHLISEELPARRRRHGVEQRPITGQAAWYDVRVRIYAGRRRRAAADLAAGRAGRGRARHGRGAEAARLDGRAGPGKKAP